MTKLLTIQRSKSLCDKLLLPFAFIEALLIFLCVSSTHKIFFACMATFTIMPLTFKWKYLLVTAASLGVILIVYFLTKPHFGLPSAIMGDFKVNRIITMGSIVSFQDHNVLIKTKLPLNQYDVINVKGALFRVVNTSDFDLVTYLKSLNVFYIVPNPSITLLERSSDIRVAASKFISSGGEWYEQITPLVFLGDKTSSSKAIYDLSIKMNVVHLFVISGFHISLLYALISKPLLWLRCNKSFALWFPLLPIWVYLFFLGFPVSALRAALLTTFIVINKEILKNKFNSLEVLSLVLILMVAIDPMGVFSLSFIFTFIATYIIIFINQLKFKSKTLKWILIVIFAYASNVLIAIYTNQFFSVFGILFGVFLTPVFILIYSLTMFLFPFKEFLNQIDYYFILVLKAFNQINILITIPKFNIDVIYGVYGFVWSALTLKVFYKFLQNKGCRVL